MFDVGFTELLILFVISLLVLGPEKLPAFAKKVGMYIRKAQAVFYDVRREVERELEMEEVKKRMQQNNILSEEAAGVTEEIKEVADSLKKPINMENPDNKEKKADD
ncbi:Sec-independent protein translocase protein TatB [Marinicella sp. W31]|uniref:Sec-independent protein translocase protein TatB n=1 Tax=Marinicella sp. W31 TaxID=3023713 RepID=UPI00375684FC